jgi:hypothetical protein
MFVIFNKAFQAFLLFGVFGCLDVNHVCGPHQRKDINYYCICVSGAVSASDNNGCVLCGENQVVQNDKCVCAAGFLMNPTTQQCESAEQGSVCDPTSATPCLSPEFNHCHATSATTGYCTTSGCTASQECTNGYLCETSVAPSYCRRPPTGEGVSCQSDADCAGYDALYCEKDRTHLCLVRDCTVTPNNCFARSCCDFSATGISSTPNICILAENAAQAVQLIPGLSCSTP